MLEKMSVSSAHPFVHTNFMQLRAYEHHTFTQPGKRTVRQSIALALIVARLYAIT